MSQLAYFEGFPTSWYSLHVINFGKSTLFLYVLRLKVNVSMRLHDWNDHIHMQINESYCTQCWIILTAISVTPHKRNKADVPKLIATSSPCYQHFCVFPHDLSVTMPIEMQTVWNQCLKFCIATFSPLPLLQMFLCPDLVNIFRQDAFDPRFILMSVDISFGHVKN